MSDISLLITGIVGSGVSAICCFTPAAVMALGALGLSAWTGWLDYVLLPALAIFLGVTVLAVFRIRRRKAVPE